MDETPRAYGLDLAGYSNGKSGFAMAQGQTVTVFDDHPFMQKRSGSAALAETVAAERAAIDRAISQGVLMVDIPVSLSPLPAPEDARYIWQLTQRPVDYAFGAMPPLADRIGYPVARFQYLLQDIGDHSRIYETYPALMLRLLGLPSTGYKGHPITFDGQVWRGGDRLAEIAKALGFVAEAGFVLNDDDFDAALCALAGIASEQNRLLGAELDAMVTERIHQKIGGDENVTYVASQNFMVMKKAPTIPIRLVRLSYSV